MNSLPLEGGPPDSFGAHNHDPSLNRRKSGGSAAYPFLLLLSTGVAGLFCYLYLTKPVVVESQPASEIASIPAAAERNIAPSPLPLPPTPPVAASQEKPAPAALTLAPSGQRLPGDLAPSAATPRQTLGKTGANPFEETNLRVQHVLIAEAPGGARNRLEFEVPVLYRSRNLRWSHVEVLQARELLGKLADYQDKTRSLRAEGIALLDAWNQLIGRSIPSAGLRADSPSLPANQNEAAGSKQSPSLDTTEAIRINPTGQ